MYLIVTKKGKERWHPYGTRLFNSKKDAVSSVQVGISTYPENIFAIAYIGDKEDWEKSAVGQTIKE